MGNDLTIDGTPIRLGDLPEHIQVLIKKILDSQGVEPQKAYKLSREVFAQLDALKTLENEVIKGESITIDEAHRQVEEFVWNKLTAYHQTPLGQFCLVTGCPDMGKSYSTLKMLSKFMETHKDSSHRVLYIVPYFDCLKENDYFPQLNMTMIKGKILRCTQPPNKLVGTGMKIWEKDFCKKCHQKCGYQSQFKMGGNWCIAEARVPYMNFQPFDIIIVDEFPGGEIELAIPPTWILELKDNLRGEWRNIVEAFEDIARVLREERIDENKQKKAYSTYLSGEEILERMRQKNGNMFYLRDEVIAELFSHELTRENPVAGPLAVNFMQFKDVRVTVRPDGKVNFSKIHNIIGFFENIARQGKLILVLDGNSKVKNLAKFDEIMDPTPIIGQDNIFVEALNDKLLGKSELVQDDKTRMKLFEYVYRVGSKEPDRKFTICGVKEVIFKMVKERPDILKMPNLVKSPHRPETGGLCYFGALKNTNIFKDVNLIVVIGANKIPPDLYNYLHKSSIDILEQGEIEQMAYRSRPLSGKKERVDIILLTNQPIKMYHLDRNVVSKELSERLEEVGLLTVKGDTKRRREIRDAKVLRMVREGKTNREIIEALGISRSTVKNIKRANRKVVESLK